MEEAALVQLSRVWRMRLRNSCTHGKFADLRMGSIKVLGPATAMPAACSRNGWHARGLFAFVEDNGSVLDATSE